MSPSSQTILRVAAGAALFGVLMTLREHASSTWSRLLLAALAGAVLGGLVLAARSQRGGGA